MGREEVSQRKVEYFAKLEQLLDEYPKCFLVSFKNFLVWQFNIPTFWEKVNTFLFKMMSSLSLS